MKIIVSCTTLPNRLDILYYTVQSIYKQSVQPDMFIINLSKEEFEPIGGYSIPQWLQDERITVNLTEDIGPFTKFIPTLEFASMDDIIITIDDDILYGPQLIEQLLDEHKKDPDKIICTRARIIKKNAFNNWMNYDNWVDARERMTSANLLHLGVGGVLYNKKFFDLDLLLDEEYKKICPKNDDLWFKIAGLANNTKVTVIPSIDKENLKIIHDDGLEDNNLYKDNGSKSNVFVKAFNNIKNKYMNFFGINASRNDVYWDNICAYVKSKGIKINI